MKSLQVLTYFLERALPQYIKALVFRAIDFEGRSFHDVLCLLDNVSFAFCHCICFRFWFIFNLWAFKRRFFAWLLNDHGLSLTTYLTQ